MKNFKMALLAMVLVVTSVLFATCSNKEEEKKADAKTEERTVKHAKGKLKFLQTQRKLLTLVVQQKNY